MGTAWALVCLLTLLDTLVIGEVDVFTKESALRGHKYRAGKAVTIAVDVEAIVIVIAVVSILCECKLSRETWASHAIGTESMRNYNEIRG